jgi:hypothetical protein
LVQGNVYDIIDDYLVIFQCSDLATAQQEAIGFSFVDNGYFFLPRPDQIQKKRVLVCSCSASELLKQNYRDLVSKVTHVFVDEASQALEAECLIPLTLTKRKIVFMAGDPHQLGPQLHCPEVASVLGESFQVRRKFLTNKCAQKAERKGISLENSDDYFT